MRNNTRTISDSFKIPRILLFTGIALIATVVLVILGIRYPLPFIWKVIPLFTYAILMWIRPEAWLLIVPAILPISDLAPWTGWLFVEELDLLLLVTIAVGYLRTAARPMTNRLPGGVRVLFALLAVSYLISALRALIPLQTFDANALSNYASPYNALHIAKGFVWAWLLMPLLMRTAGSQGENIKQWFFPGIVIGLIGVCLIAMWERAAFPGFLNFSADYRTTANFSAMHVGGAALDGFLALSMPFACVLFFPERKVKENILGLVILAVSTYVLLTTFSRGLYAGYGLAALILLFAFNKSATAARDKTAVAKKGNAWVLLPLLALLAWLLYLEFGTGGYRALAATLVFFAGAFYVGGRQPTNKSRVWWPIAFVPLAGLSMLMANVIPKGAYIIFAIAALSLMVFIAADLISRKGTLLNGLYLTLAWVAVTGLLVAMHWGGSKAVLNAIFPMILIASVAFVNRRLTYPIWQISKQSIVTAGASGVALALLIPIAGNDYSHQRFSRTSADMVTRTAHWTDVLNVMNGDAMTTAFGMGLGRFPMEYFWRNTQGETPGSFLFMNDLGNQFVRLAGPRYPIGYGEVLRFGQRVPVKTGESYRLHLSFRTKSPKAVLDTGLCEKLLLYNRVCSYKGLSLEPADGEWHEITADLNAISMNDGPWYLPRPVQLWIGNGNAGVAVDVDNIRLIDSAGREHTRNSDFERGNDFWFYSSDNYHLPWHAKNLWLNVYFDQGLLGLILFSMLLLYALTKLLKRLLNGDRSAGVFFAAIIAFLAVGLFDSLIDVPRIATLFFLILLAGLLKEKHFRN